MTGYHQTCKKWFLDFFLVDILVFTFGIYTTFAEHNISQCTWSARLSVILTLLRSIGMVNHRWVLNHWKTNMIITNCRNPHCINGLPKGVFYHPNDLTLMWDRNGWCDNLGNVELARPDDVDNDDLIWDETFFSFSELWNHGINYPHQLLSGHGILQKFHVSWNSPTLLLTCPSTLSSSGLLYICPLVYLFQFYSVYCPSASSFHCCLSS